jgi:transcriptional regulator with XRE-family HTH domain
MKGDNDMTVSEIIKLAREKRDLSYSELSKLTGIAKSTLQRYETGTTVKMPLDALKKIAIAINVAPAYLMGWTDDPTNYDDPELIANLAGPVLDYFDGDAKKAMEFQRAVDDSVLMENMSAAWREQKIAPDDQELLDNFHALSPGSQLAVRTLIENLKIADAESAKEPKKEA